MYLRFYHARDLFYKLCNHWEKTGVCSRNGLADIADLVRKKQFVFRKQKDIF